MAERISVPANELDPQQHEYAEKVETTIAHLIEYVMHNVERPASREYAQDAREAFHNTLTELLKELRISHIEEVIEHLEERLKRGQHDLVVEFLSNLAKLQHADFAQEFLHFQAIPVTAQTDDDTLQREVPLIGHTAITHYDQTLAEE